MKISCLSYSIDKKKPFPVYDWKGDGWRDFIVEQKRESLVVDGYSIPIKEDNEFVFSCKKTFIKARGGAEGLYQYLQNKHTACSFKSQLLSWIVTFGKREEGEERE